MLVTETLAPGLSADLFRSGRTSPLPSSPTDLAVIIVPAQKNGGSAVSPTQLDDAAGKLVGTTFKVSGILPLSIMILTASAALLKDAVSLTMMGTLALRLGLFNPGFAFTFTMSLALGPSGDPSETSRVLAATVAAPSPNLTVPGVPTILPGGLGIGLSQIAGSMASTVASMVEAQVNQMIASLAPEAAANLGQELTPTAVISAVRVAIAPSGIAMILAVGDLFGPGIVPIPGSLNADIEPAPVPHIEVDYTVTVTDAASRKPVENATVTLTNPGSGEGQGKSNKDGQLTFKQVTLESQQITVGKNKIIIYPLLTVTALGFNDLRRILYLAGK
jgi:hypothetical protein